MSFNKLGLSSWLVKQCATLGIKDPTPIQENCIPNILSGKDCIGAAKTGSGKTLAFALPILQKLSEDPYGIFALVLTPTRELACQIADQFAVIGKPVNLKVCTVIGGVDMVEQGIALSKRPHIVVATPGRLVDHLESCDTFTLMKLRFLVLDEADRLLGGHYDEQIKAIFKRVPKEKQCLFFSATITDTLQKLKGFLKKDVFSYEAPLENASLTVQSLQQHYVLCPEYVRDAYLVQTLRQLPQKSTTIIFTNTCRKCQILSMMLDEVGFENVALHGMMPQNQRSATLAKFRSNTVKILVTTDVASRGLDIPHVEVVINHCMPNIAKEYVHRVGRTARAGKGGTAISILGPGELDKLKNVEEFIGVKLTEFKVDDSEVGKIFTQISVTESEAHLTLEEKDFYEKRRINRRKKWILEGLDPDEEEEKLMKKRKDKKRKRKNNKQEIDNKIQKKE